VRTGWGRPDVKPRTRSVSGDGASCVVAAERLNGRESGCFAEVRDDASSDFALAAASPTVGALSPEGPAE
jgi:hypothetical protein